MLRRGGARHEGRPDFYGIFMRMAVLIRSLELGWWNSGVWDQIHAFARDLHDAPAGRPRWGVLHALVLPQLTALAVVEVGGPPDGLRLTLGWSLAMGTLATMAAWVRRNQVAIDLRVWCACAPQTITTRVIESRRLLPVPGPERASNCQRTPKRGPRSPSADRPPLFVQRRVQHEDVHAWLAQEAETPCFHVRLDQPAAGALIQPTRATDMAAGRASQRPSVLNAR